MPSKIRAALSKIPKLLWVLAWITIVLMLSGHWADRLVEWANGGTMPVAMKKEDILFVVAIPHKLMENIFSLLMS